MCVCVCVNGVHRGSVLSVYRVSVGGGLAGQMDWKDYQSF